MSPQFSRLRFLFVAALSLLSGFAYAQTQPNVILIFVDDMGVNDIGAYAYPSGNPYPGSGPAPIAYSSSFNPLPAPNEAAGLTPNIDSLGTQGIRMTSFYAAAPVCTPSRAGLLTGTYPTRVDLEGVIFRGNQKWGLNPSEVTIAERLRQAGYATGLVGKWHVGTFGPGFGMDFHPTHHGFETFFGLPASNDAWLRTLWDGVNEVTSYTTGTGGTLTSPVDTVSEQRHLLEALTEKSIDFIQAADAAGKPFFLYFASHAPHTPCWPHPDYINASGASQYYDVVAELDARVGQILAELDSLGIANNTLVMFTSDNGPWVDRPDRSLPEQRSGSAYPYRGYKRGANEGGPRVPFLARLPGQIPAGIVTDELGSSIDFLPTLLALADEALPAATIDGVNLWPLLSGQTSTSPRGEFFYYEENDGSAVGVRQGNNKLLNKSDYGATTGWFDLSSDIQESSSLGSNSTLANLITNHNNAMVRRSRATSKDNWIEIDNDSVTVAEGGTATFKVRLYAAANATVTISRFSGDTDLTVQSGGSLVFTTANYDQWQTVTLAAAIDADASSDGATFRATASGLYLREIFALESDLPQNPQGRLSLSASTFSGAEGDGAVTVSFQRVGGSTGAVSVNYATSDGTASAGNDYTATSGTLNWADGDSADKSFDIPITDDSVFAEGDETLTVTLSAPGGGATLGLLSAATVTIEDNDLPATLQLAESTAAVGEGDGALTLSVSRSGGSSGAVSIDYTTADGSAAAGSDYIATSGTLNWADGDSADKLIQIPIIDDSETETDESFSVTLSGPGGGAILGSSSSATVTLSDNDIGAPATIPDLVGWYDAQTLSGADGSAVTLWADLTGGTNVSANNLLQVTSVSGTPVAPTLETISLNGFNYRSVRFNTLSGNQYELLKAPDLVANGDTNRSIIVVYKGGVNDANSRPVGFGSTLDEPGISNDKNTWNLGADGNGTSRFDGSKIDTGYSAGLTRTDFLIRTAVMESATSFDEYIDILDANFADTQVLSNGSPNNALSTTRGHFYLGDMQSSNIGGGAGDSDFDIVEVLVYDRALNDLERQAVQSYLSSKYTSDPAPLTPAQIWRQIWFGQTEDSGDAADDFDFDRDGLINLLERAYGTNPTLAALSPIDGVPPTESFAQDAESEYLALTYRRLSGGTGTTGVDYSADGMLYIVEYDDDLSPPWGTGSVAQVGSAIDNGDGTETVTVRMTTPTTGSSKQFIRLRVSSQP